MHLIRAAHGRVAVFALCLAALGVLTACSLAGDRNDGTAAGAGHPARPSSGSSSAPAASQSSKSSTNTPVRAPAVKKAVSVPVRAAVAPPACAGNKTDQLVLVQLDVQRMWLCQRDHQVLTTAITSGMAGADTRTPTGTYHIQGRNKNSVLNLADGSSYDVKYWIPFDAPMFGFHDSSWQKFPYGSAQYRTAGSHGCVHMPLAAIRALYNWVDIGAKVVIRH